MDATAAINVTGTTVIAGAGFAVTLVTSTWRFAVSLYSNVQLMGILLLIAIFGVFWIPYQARIMNTAMFALTETGYFYENVIRPIIATFSEVLNALICWWDFISYIMGRFWRNLIFDIIGKCTTWSAIINPSVGILRASLVDIAAGQVLTLQFVSKPINITSLRAPIEELAYVIENATCCACMDLCPLVRVLFSPIHDPALWCFIQNVLNAAFFLLRPILEFVIRLIYAQTPPRPNWQNLGTYLCAAFDCGTAVLTNFIQRVLDDIVFASLGLPSLFQVSSITCLFVNAGCLASFIVTTILDLAFNVDKALQWPCDPYMGAETGFRGNLRRVLNGIALPTEVVNIESYGFFTTDNVAIHVSPSANCTNNGRPYVYNTTVQIGVTGNAIRFDQCLCNTVEALLSTFITDVFSPCGLIGVLTQAVDLVFFIMDMALNIYHFKNWVRRWDFAWLEGIFSPRKGPFKIVTDLIGILGDAGKAEVEVIFTIISEQIRFLGEAVRMGIMGEDSFGVFMPDGKFTGPHIRCSRSTVNPVQAAQSCSVGSFARIYFPSLMATFREAMCNQSRSINSLFSIDGEPVTLDGNALCCAGTNIETAMVSAMALLVEGVQNMVFGDYDFFWRGPNSRLQDLLESIARSVFAAVGCSCGVVQNVFKYLKLSDSGNPCTCMQEQVPGLIASLVRLVSGVLVNFSRSFSINAPYFKAGIPQGFGVTHTFLSQLNKIGRPVVGGLKGDVEYVIDALVGILLCPLSLANLIPGFDGVLDYWHASLSGIVGAIIRAVIITLLSAAQADGDFFLDFTDQGYARDTFWRQTTRMFALWMAPLDLIQTPIIWQNTAMPPDMTPHDFGNPNNYPVALDPFRTPLPGTDTATTAKDFANPYYADGYIGDIPTVMTALAFTLDALFGHGIGTKILCPVRRGLRIIISAVGFLGELAFRIFFSLINGTIYQDVFKWIFGCKVPGAAYSGPLPQSNAKVSIIDTTVVAATCADTDGMLVAIVQLFRCPCDWIGQISAPFFGCLCGSPADPDQDIKLSLINSAGTLTAWVEFLGEAAQKAVLVFRDAFTFKISIKYDVLYPMLMSTARLIYGSTCTMISFFGDGCSKIYWAKVVLSAAKLAFSLPIAFASVISREMDQNIVVEESVYTAGPYPGGQVGFSFSGFNDYRGMFTPGGCNPAKTPRACNHRNADTPKDPSEGTDGVFNMITTVLFPATQIIIDVLEFVNCAIHTSINRIPLAKKGVAAKLASTINGTIGAAIEIARITQSVFFSLLWFFWQFFRLLTWFLTRNFGDLDITKLIDAAKNMFKTTIRALAGLFTDTHEFYQGDADLKTKADCAKKFAAGVIIGSILYAKCLRDIKKQTSYPTTLIYIKPGLEARGTLNDGGNSRAERAAQTSTIPSSVTGHSKSAYWLDVLTGAAAFNEKPCRHDDLAPCICPYDPQVEGDTDLCSRNTRLTPGEEEDLLDRAAEMVWTGDTRCDAMMRDAARRGWATIGTVERIDLAACMDLRAAGIRTVDVMCGSLAPNVMCAWSPDLWYQTNRMSSFLETAHMAEEMRMLERVHPGGPTRKEAIRIAHEASERLLNMTGIPASAYGPWIEGELATRRSGRPLPKFKSITDGDRARENATRIEEEARKKAAEDTAPPRTANMLRGNPESPWAPMDTVYTDEEIVSLKLYREREHARLVQEIKRNMTLGEYDEDTMAWLEGHGELPMDIGQRKNGAMLIPAIMVLGTPTIRARRDAKWNDIKWWADEPHHTKGGRKRMEREAAITDKQREDEYFANYDVHTLSGVTVRRDRRTVYHSIEGIHDHSQYFQRPGTKRSPEENLATWNERVAKRMIAIRGHAERAGVIGHNASAIHGAHPDLQAVLLRGTQSLDYLMYGWLTGAFVDYMDYDGYNDRPPPVTPEEEASKSKWFTWWSSPPTPPPVHAQPKSSDFVGNTRAGTASTEHEQEHGHGRGGPHKRARSEREIWENVEAEKKLAQKPPEQPKPFRRPPPAPGKRGNRYFNGPRSAIEDSITGVSEAWSGYTHINAVLQRHGGYALHEVPGALWNVAKYGSRVFMGSSMQTDAEKAKAASAQEEEEADLFQGYVGTKYYGTKRHVESDSSDGSGHHARGATEGYERVPKEDDPPPYVPEDGYIEWKGPKLVWKLWEVISEAVSNRTEQIINDANESHNGRIVEASHKRSYANAGTGTCSQRDVDDLNPDCVMPTHLHKRFIVGDNCLIVKTFIEEFLAAITFCTVYIPLPPVTKRDVFGVFMSPDTSTVTTNYMMRSRSAYRAERQHYRHLDSIARNATTGYAIVTADDAATTNLDPTEVTGTYRWWDHIRVAQEAGQGNSKLGVRWYPEDEEDDTGEGEMVSELVWLTGDGEKYTPIEITSDPFSADLEGRDRPASESYQWRQKSKSRVAGEEEDPTAHHHHGDRAIVTEHSYGPLWSELSLLVRFADWIGGKIGWHFGLFAFMTKVLNGSGDFFTNPNIDEDLGPIGFKGWLDIITKCRFPRSVSCARGVGAVKTIKRFAPWVLIAAVVIAWFVPSPFNMALFFVGSLALAVILPVYAWRYSLACIIGSTSPPFVLIPICIVNEIDAVIAYFLRPCYDFIKPYMVADGITCKPQGQMLQFIDCTAVGVSTGATVIATAARFFNRRACSVFAATLETLVIFGPHWAGNPVVKYVRNACELVNGAGPILKKQQNFCAVSSSSAIGGTLLILLLVALFLVYVIAILSAAFGLGGILGNNLMTVMRSGSDVSTVTADNEAERLDPYDVM